MIQLNQTALGILLSRPNESRFCSFTAQQK